MKYLGVDYGLKKVGLAISEGFVAQPLKVLEVSSLKDAVVRVMRVIKDEGVDLVVVGMPEGGRAARVTKRFVGELRKYVKVLEADETLSSRRALSLMIETGFSKKNREKEDAVSAALILQEFLDNLVLYAKKKSAE